MPEAIERALATALAEGVQYMGEVAVQRTGDAYMLCHREEMGCESLTGSHSADDAIAIARLDGAGKFRPLKTAPNLSRGWRLDLATVHEVTRALEHFYPGRLAVWLAFTDGRLQTTTLRDTLGRQTGMYRVTAAISDGQADEVVAATCQSSTGCLRSILWKRDASGASPSTKLPSEKFDPARDQYRRSGETSRAIPLLCQEACAILLGACRAAMKTAGNATASSAS